VFVARELFEIREVEHVTVRGADRGDGFATAVPLDPRQVVSR
jgi:hypothetical protein